MARVVNAERSTVVGTIEQIRQFMDDLAGERSAVVNMAGSNFVILSKPVTSAQLAQALRITPSPASTRRGRSRR